MMKEKLALQWFADCIYKAFQRDNWKLVHLRENHKTQSVSLSYFLDLTLALNSLAERNKGIRSSPPQKKFLFLAVINQSLLSALTEYDMPSLYSILSVYTNIMLFLIGLQTWARDFRTSLWMFYCSNRLCFTSVLSQKSPQNIMIVVQQCSKRTSCELQWNQGNLKCNSSFYIISINM